MLWEPGNVGVVFRSLKAMYARDATNVVGYARSRDEDTLSMTRFPDLTRVSFIDSSDCTLAKCTSTMLRVECREWVEVKDSTRGELKYVAGEVCVMMKAQSSTLHQLLSKNS